MQRAARLVGAAVGVVILSCGGLAAAQRAYPGNNELSGHLGASISLNDFTPGGFKLENEYNYRLSNVTWFNAQLNFALGGRPGYYDYYGRCYDPVRNRYYDCYGHFAGNAIELVAGVKLKFGRGKLEPFAKFGGGLVFSFFPGNLNATAIVFRGGGSVHYFVLRQLAVGGEAVLSLGPNIVEDPFGTYVYATLDILGGVEWIF